MVISDQLQFVFLGIPRTANRAMHLALLQLPGAYQFGRLHTMDIPPSCRAYFTFCAVRNPYRRFLAYYLWRRAPHPWGSDAAGMSFADYIAAAEEGRMGPCTVRGHTDPQRLDAVIRYEDLPGSFHALQGVPGIGQLELGPVGQRLSRHWQYFYDDALAQRVYQLTRADFEEFGYDPESWKLV
jgi:hypothetical protein